MFYFLFRPSSPYLAQAVIDGVQAIGGSFTDYGVCATPQLHFYVTCKNTNGEYGEPNEVGYFSKLATAFRSLRGSDFDKASYKHSLQLDGANGVGALKMRMLQQYLGECLDVAVFNNGDGKLNFQCGADFVKVQQKPPQVFYCLIFHSFKIFLMLLYFQEYATRNWSARSFSRR